VAAQTQRVMNEVEGTMLSQGALVRAIGLPCVHLDKVRRGPVGPRR